MYRPAQFREDRPEVLIAAVNQLRLATVITFSGAELVASHIPMLFKTDDKELRLEGHVARANPQWKNIEQRVDALALFLGPHAYISPSWYAAKAEHQRVVPTWNYISVEAAGPLSIIDDKQWLLRHISELTEHNESGLSEPWAVADAPAEFVEQLSGAIVGLSMQVRRLEGTWKMAQHRSAADRLGVMKGLNELEDLAGRAVAAEMARLEAERSP
ncbi:MAG: FMN-binding negative transcriptional regulator [Candidatus Sumerlaeaceae bacterium]